MTAYRYKNVCSSETSVLTEAIKSSYPMFMDSEMFYLSDGVQFRFTGNSVSYTHIRKSFNGNASPVTSDVTMQLPACENLGVFEQILPLDFGVIVFLVMSFLLGLAVGVRGHG